MIKSNIIARHTSRNAGTTSPHMGGLGGLLFLALLASCTSDDLPEAVNQEIRLRSSISVEQQSRAASDLLTSYFDNGDQIDVKISEQTTDDALYSLLYTTESDGKLSDPVNANNGESVTPYYPASGNGVNIYAVYPSTATSGDFTVESDQTDDDNYKASDLMYAHTSSQATTDAITLSFAHQLSKVTITLEADETSITTADLDGAVVKLINVSTYVPVTIDKSALTLGTATNTSNVKVFKVAGSNLTGSCIVPPQTLSSTQFAQVIIGYKSFIATLSSAPTWDKGMAYSYTIKMAYDAVTVSPATITDWTPNDATDIDTSMKKIGTKTAANAAVGDFYMSDGSLVGSDEDLTDEQKAACIGVVFCTNTERIGDAEKEALGGTAHGLVIAKKNVGSYAWGTYQDESSMTNVSKWEDAQKYINGLADYNTILSTYSSSLSNYPAFYNTSIFSETLPCPDNTTGWFIPSIGQWFDIIDGICDISTSKSTNYKAESDHIKFFTNTSYEAFDNIMNKINGDTMGSRERNFWSSTEGSESGLSYWIRFHDYYYNSAFGIIIGSANKESSFLVRPILAF